MLLYISFLLLSSFLSAQHLSDAIFNQTVQYPGTDLTTFFELINGPFPAIYDLADSKKAPKTLFAPSDLAFAEWNWTKSPTEMERILRYHFVHGKWIDLPPSTDPALVQSFQLNTYGNALPLSLLRIGEKHFIHDYKGNVNITAGPFVDNSTAPTNILYIIDRVLMPPPILLSSMGSALPQTLNADSLIAAKTIFIVMDTPANKKYFDSFNGDKQQLLAYHSSEELVYLADAVNAFTLPTMSGDTALFYQYRNSKFINNARVVQGDIYLENGSVAHIIDRWLNPGITLSSPQTTLTASINEAALYYEDFHTSDAPYGGFPEYLIDSENRSIFVPLLETGIGYNLNSCLISTEGNQVNCEDGVCTVFGNCLDGYCDGLTNCLAVGADDCMTFGNCDTGKCTVIGGCMRTTIDPIQAEIVEIADMTNAGESSTTATFRISPMLFAIIIAAAILF